MSVTDTRMPVTPNSGAAVKSESEALHSLILTSLDEDAATEVVSIPLGGKSSEADMMVVASGRSNRHVAALADKLVDRIKHDAQIVPRIEGKDTADWILIDAGDVIVHIFRPEVREFYQLEKMWQPTPDSQARPADPT